MCFGGGGTDGIKETEDQRVLAEIGAEKIEEYMSMYPEVENEFFQSVDNLNSSQSMQRGATEASTNVSGAYSGAVDNTVNQMTSAGINPNSGNFKQAIVTAGVQEGADRLHNTNQTQQALQDSYLQGKAGIVAMGQGQEANAIQGFGNIAQESHRSAISSASRDFNRTSQRNSAIATGLGAGVGAFSGNRRSGINLNDQEGS